MDIESIMIFIFVVLLTIAYTYGTLKLISRAIEFLEVKTVYYKMLIDKERKENFQ